MEDKNVKDMQTPENGGVGSAAQSAQGEAHSENAMKGINAALDILKELGVEPEEDSQQSDVQGGTDSTLDEDGDIFVIEDEITDGEGISEDGTIVAEEQTTPEEDADIPEEDEDVKIFGAPTKTFKRGKKTAEDSKESAEEVGFSFFEEEPEGTEPEGEIFECDDQEVFEETAEDIPEDESEDGEYRENDESEDSCDEDTSEYDEKYADDVKDGAAVSGSEAALEALFNDHNDDDDAKGKRKKKPKKNKDDKKRSDTQHLLFDEEIDLSDKESVAKASAAFDRRKANALVSLVGSMVCFFLVMYTELAPISNFLPHSARMSAASPAFYALIDLQLMLFGVMFLFDSLAKGIENWIDRRVMTPAAVSLTMVVATALQAIVTAFIGTPENLRLFCSLGSASLVMLALYDYLAAGADKRSFKMVSLESTKFGASTLSRDSADCVPFKDKLADENSCAMSITKGMTYKRFAERTSALPESEKKLWITSVIVLGVALLIGFISSIAARSIYSGISDAVLIYASAVPLNIFLASSLPRHIAIKRGKDINATMVGQNAGDDFKNLSVVTFADTAVFLPRDTRVESRIIVDTERFCDIILTMVKIFRHVGGPMRGVFDRDLPNPDQEIPADVKLLSVSQNAIEVTVDGKPYTVASDKHLSASGIKFRRQDGDERYNLLFLLENGRILAKFRIDYRVDERFERTASELYDVHISVGIKTVTPGINDAFLRTLRELDSCNFAVIRGSGEKDIPTTAPECDSSIIALGSVHKFLEMLLICENSVRRTRINSVIRHVSCGICLFVASWLIITNAVLPVEFGLIIQAFWMLLVTFNSYLKR